MTHYKISLSTFLLPLAVACVCLPAGGAQAGTNKHHGQLAAMCEHLFRPNSYRIPHEYQRCFRDHDRHDRSNYIVEFPGYDYGRSTSADYFIGGTPGKPARRHAGRRHRVM